MRSLIGRTASAILFGSTQSQSFPIPGIAQLVGVEPADLVYVSEFCGGGFGSKGGAYPLMVLPALMAKKIGRPVMMRVSRHEEYSMGSARAGFQGRVKMGFAADGRVTAVDLYIVQENGPNTGFNDWTSAAEAVSIVYQPPAMRFRGVPVLTNTPPRGPQRGPGQNQIAAAIEPLVDKAAKQLGLDRVAIRRINAPDNAAKVGSMQGGVTSAHLKDALERGAELFNWTERQARSGQRNGSKVRAVGVGTAYHSAGGNGFDGLVRITPDGKIHIHTGVGNLGTYSHTVDVARRGRSAEGELGQLHRRAGRQPQPPAVESRAVRQQHVVHDDAHELRRGDGCRREAQGDRRAGSGRRAGRLRHRRRARVREERLQQRASRMPRRRSGRSSSAASSTATRSRTT